METYKKVVMWSEKSYPFITSIWWECFQGFMLHSIYAKSKLVPVTEHALGKF